MTPAELAHELNLKPDDIPRICKAMKIPMPEDQGFTAQQFLRISRYVSEVKAAANPEASGEKVDKEQLTQSGVPTDKGDAAAVKSPPPKVTPLPSDPLDKVKTAEARVGKYLLKRTLGSGGMGQVWLARDTVADIDVALKVLPEAFRTNPEEQERLKRSFQMVQALPPHPAICQLRDLQHDQALGYFLVMEYIDGVTLSTYRYEYEKKHGSFPLSELVRILDMIADALDYAHDRKLIHRDIKPSNALISHDGQEVRVIDFQLAWEIRTTTSRITRDQKVDNSGTYPYMSPELWLGQRASKASDQYALAMLTFELLDGHLPYEASDQTSWSIIVTNPNTRIPEIDGLPAYAQSALAKALHFDPKQRFDTCRQFVEALAGQESRETENFVNWKSTDVARNWITGNNGTWSHQDWLQLLESLRRSEFWPMRESDIGELLDELRLDLAAQNKQRTRPIEVDDSDFIDENEAEKSESKIGTQVKVAGYPPLADELLAAEVEHQRQLELLKQVEDGVHPVLTAGRKRLAELQQAFNVLNKEHERNPPHAAPGVLEAITEAISRDANISLGKLSQIPNAPKQEELYGYAQRAKRVLAAKAELENAQKQALVDRQTFSDKLRKEVDQTFARLVSLREADFVIVCQKLFDRVPSTRTAFPTEEWIKELPSIRVRRYHWSDHELLTMAESALINRSDDLEFDVAAANGSKEAYTAYLRKWPSGRNKQKADSELAKYRMKAEQELAARDDAEFEHSRIEGVEALEDYLKAWPSGRHREDAKVEISRLQALRNEKQDWENACRRGGDYNFRSFIRRYPNSSFCEAARRRIRTINGIEKVKNLNPKVSFSRFCFAVMGGWFISVLFVATIPSLVILGWPLWLLGVFCIGYLDDPGA